MAIENELNSALNFRTNILNHIRLIKININSAKVAFSVNTYIDNSKVASQT